MATIKLTTPDLRELTARIAQAERTFGHPEPLLKAWGVTVLGLIDQNFRAGGTPAWAPLRPSTTGARRQGKGTGSARPLQNTGAFRRSFDFTTDPKRLVVFSRSPVHAFHEEGTRGPYEIRAKNAKALAIPTGAYTLSGLGASKPTGRGSFLFTPKPGQKIPKRLAGRIGKAVAPFKSVTFRQKVTHPGLPARPVFPTQEQAVPALAKAADVFLSRVFDPKRAAASGGKVAASG